MYLYPAFIIFTIKVANISNTSYSYFLPHNNPVRSVRLRESDSSKFIQLGFMAKAQFELTVACFLGWCPVILIFPVSGFCPLQNQIKVTVQHSLLNVNTFPDVICKVVENVTVSSNVFLCISEGFSWYWELSICFLSFQFQQYYSVKRKLQWITSEPFIKIINDHILKMRGKLWLLQDCAKWFLTVAIFKIFQYNFSLEKKEISWCL